MKVLLLAAAVVMAGALATPTMAATHHVVHHHVVHRHAVHHHDYVYRHADYAPPPIGTIHLHGGSVGFIVGVGGADGYVDFRGARYPIEVSGLKVGTIGISSYDLDGQVLNIHHIEEIEGSYSAGEASATAIAGAGSVDMTNGNGVEIRATSSTGGLELTLAGGGVNIRLKR
jgi:hypothetical protein